MEQMEGMTVGRQIKPDEMKTTGIRFSRVEEDRYTVHKSKDNCAVHTNRAEDRDRQIEQTTIVQCTNGTEDKDRQMMQKTIVQCTLTT